MMDYSNSNLASNIKHKHVQELLQKKKIARWTTPRVFIKKKEPVLDSFYQPGFFLKPAS
jgi:hypothetical protein